MNKRVFIVHCWEGNPEYAWYPWLKTALESRGFDVLVPAMLNPDTPDKTAWVDCLAKTVGTVTNQDYFIGHSIGCMTILRFLEQLPENQVAGGTVLVGGYGKDLVYEGYKGELSSFYQDPINWEKIRHHCSKFVAIHSSNDPWVPLEHAKVFEEQLGAQLIVLNNRGHFDEDSGTSKLPEALDAVLSVVD